MTFCSLMESQTTPASDAPKGFRRINNFHFPCFTRNWRNLALFVHDICSRMANKVYFGDYKELLNVRGEEAGGTANWCSKKNTFLDLDLYFPPFPLFSWVCVSGSQCCMTLHGGEQSTHSLWLNNDHDYDMRAGVTNVIISNRSYRTWFLIEQ